MRYIYNCVKLVLLIAGLCFAGQSSAADPVELGGLLFDMSKGKLQVSMTDYCKQFMKRSATTKPVDGVFVDNCDFFALYFEEGFALERVCAAEPGKRYSDIYRGKSTLLPALLIWSAGCIQGAVHEEYDEVEEEYSIVEEVLLTHYRISDEISKLFRVGVECKSEKFGIKFTKDDMGGVMVRVGEESQMTRLDNWIKDALLKSKPEGSCLHRHEYDGIDGEYVELPVFVDLSKLNDVLAPVVDALQNSAMNEGGTAGGSSNSADFQGFAEIFPTV